MFRNPPFRNGLFCLIFNNLVFISAVDSFEFKIYHAQIFALLERVEKFLVKLDGAVGSDGGRILEHFDFFVSRRILGNPVFQFVLFIAYFYKLFIQFSFGELELFFFAVEFLLLFEWYRARVFVSEILF